MTKKRIYLNAFDMNCITHQSPGLWRHPKDQSSKYNTLEYWTNLAKILEKGKFDGLFLADVIGLYDVYKNGKETAISEAAQVPVNDPILLVSAMAAVTKHLGFGITASSTFEHPYTFARRMSTLDHLTNGRAAWNIVTSYLESGTKNIEIGDKFEHAKRYDIADEYLEVCYKLWENSWEDDAVQKNVETGVYTDASKVHEINHKGTYFEVPGIHLCEPSPQRTPVLYQAGASARGKQFAAKHAECTFISTPEKETTKKYVATLRAEVANNGRDPQSVKVFSLITIITAQTEDEAQRKYEEYTQYVSYEGAMAFLSGWSGIDFSQFDPDEELKYVETNAIKSMIESLTKNSPNKKWTTRELANYASIGGMGPVLVGTPEQVVDELEQWIADTDVDGFNIAYAISPGTFEDVVELIIPELQKRGLFKKEYEEGTLRHKLFNNGNTLNSSHTGANYKRTKVTQ